LDLNKKYLFLVNCKYNENENYFKNYKLMETVGLSPVGGQGYVHSIILSTNGSYNAEMNTSSKRTQVHCSTT